MKLYILRLSILFIAIPLLLASCKKDTEPEPITNTDLVTAHEWHGNAVLLNGVDVSSRPEIQEMLLDIKTTRLTLNRDGSYTAVYEQAGSTQTTTGSWSFKQNEEIINFDLLGDLKVERLTDTNMDLLTSVDRDGRTFEAQVRFVKGD